MGGESGCLLCCDLREPTWSVAWDGSGCSDWWCDVGDGGGVLGAEVLRSGLGWVVLGVGLVCWVGCVGCGSGWVWDAVADVSLEEDATGLLGGWWIDRFDVSSEEVLMFL